MALTQVSTGGIKDGQVQTADLADGQVTVGKLHADALDRTYTLGADGSNHYTFTGEGLTGAVNDPTLYLTRGKTYRFVNGNSAGAHPFRIQTTVNGSAGTEYNTGVTNNGGAGGSTIVFEVPHDAPDVLYYQCTSHNAMGGILYVTGALADGTVTTAKLAADAVTGAKIADDAIDSEHFADGSIDTAHIADQAVTLAKLPHGTSSNDGKFLRANNGADPSFETVTSTTINNNADNRVITGSGTANTLNGEGSFTFDSGVADITGKLRIDIDSTSGAGSGNVEAIFLRNTNETDNNAVTIFAGADDYSNAASAINFINVDHSENKGAISFDTRRPGNYGERMRILPDGGITFNGDTATANALDDYEEGTWTPAFTQGYSYVNTITYNQQVGHYTKIGNQVFAYAYMRMSGNSAHGGNIITDGNILLIGGLPYTSHNEAYTDGGGYLTYTNGIFGTNVSSEDFHCMPWVGGNSTSVSFHKPSGGGNIYGNDTNPTGKYLIFHVRYRTS